MTSMVLELSAKAVRTMTGVQALLRAENRFPTHPAFQVEEFCICIVEELECLPGAIRQDDIVPQISNRFCKLFRNQSSSSIIKIRAIHRASSRKRKFTHSKDSFAQIQTSEQWHPMAAIVGRT
jgi:hypothetical protein